MTAFSALEFGWSSARVFLAVVFGMEVTNNMMIDDKLIRHYIEYLDSGEERSALVESIAKDKGRPCYYALDRDDEYQAGGSKSGQLADELFEGLRITVKNKPTNLSKIIAVVYRDRCEECPIDAPVSRFIANGKAYRSVERMIVGYEITWGDLTTNERQMLIEEWQSKYNG
jgi:hypothetical protein